MFANYIDPAWCAAKELGLFSVKGLEPFGKEKITLFVFILEGAVHVLVDLRKLLDDRHIGKIYRVYHL